MARSREVKSVSFDPRNPRAAAVLAALKDVPRGKESETLIFWASEYLAGRAATVDEATDDDIDLDALVSALEGL